MEIQTKEIEIIGKWIFQNNQIVEDENCKRINNLISKYLKKKSTAAAGWETLYIDPYDGRYWELKYLDSELQGGGPPSLFNISDEVAKEKYNL